MARSERGVCPRLRGHLGKRKKPQLTEMLAIFRQHYEEAVPFKEDRALAADLAEQARPVFEALSEPVLGAGSEPDHEALALLNLLSRRAGLLGATPAAALGLCRGIEAALKGAEQPLAASAVDQLALVILEGYVAGRDERVTCDLRRASVEGLALLPIAPPAFALVVAGHFQADDLWPRLEEIERELLRADARALALDVRSLRYEGDDVPRLFCGLLITSRSLGVSAFVCGLEAHEQRPWLDAGLGAIELERVPTFDQAVAKALACVELELKPRRRWPGPLFRRRATDRERDPA